jgi:hypothetical protein
VKLGHESATVGEGRRRTRPWADDLIKRALGGVLCLAAVLKVVNVSTSGAAEFESLLGLVAAVVELVVGAALTFCFWPSISVPAGGLLFVLLAGASWIGTTRGAASCGCFGSVAVPPWILLILDGGAAFALLSSLWTSVASSEKRAAALIAACISSAYIGLALGSILYPRLGAMTLVLSPEAIAAANKVVLDPSELRLGRSFPLLPYIRIDVDLSRGDWKIIMARPGCPRCEHGLRAGECQPESQERVAVVLANEMAGWTLPPNCEAVVGRLSPDKTWLFQAPLIFRLTNGRITQAPGEK